MREQINLGWDRGRLDNVNLVCYGRSYGDGKCRDGALTTQNDIECCRSCHCWILNRLNLEPHLVGLLHVGSCFDLDLILVRS